MKNLKPAYIGLAILLATTAVFGQTSKYDFWDKNYSVQSLLGAVKYDGLEVQVEDSVEPTEVDISTIPQLGGAWTTAPNGERFQLGLECSFLLGFRFDSVNYAYLGGGGAYVSLSTSMWTFDLAGGGYANLFLDKGRKVRIYAGGGPLMNYADYRTDREYTDNTPEENDQESAFGLGFYARTGFEFRVNRYGMLGLGVRGTWTNADFTEISGSSELTGIAAFATFTAGF